MTGELQYIYVEIRRPRGTDPGQIEEAKFATDGKFVQLYSMQERSWGLKFRREIPEGWAPRETASRLLRSKVNTRSSDFGRKLFYPKGY
jgi:hypothetical protein